MNWKGFIFLFITSISWSQNFYLKVEGSSLTETKVLDSIGYTKKHSNVQSIIDENKSLGNKITQAGFLASQLVKNEKTNDSTFVFYYTLGTKTQNLMIKTDLLSEDIKSILGISENKTVLISETESFLNTQLAILERKGYALAKLHLENFTQVNQQLQAFLIVDLNSVRKINSLVFKGYDNFPKGVKKVYERKYKQKPFNQELVKNINRDFNTLPFVNQTKYPEVLLTKDSTQIYVYLEKRKNNSFDGFIGFGTNEEKQKLQFNGYLDLNLFNNLNSGERFNLYWKNDGNKQSTFNVNLDLAYVFKSPLALKGNLKIFKQDTIFQNSSFDFDLGYMIRYNTKIFLGIKDNTSEAIQKISAALIKDLKSTFYTTTFEHRRTNYENDLFPEQFYIATKFGLGNRTTGGEKANQFFGQIQALQLLPLNPKNYIHLKSDVYYLQSPDYYTNELYRFGGIQSIRGFNENSLQGNIFGGLFAEYRYVVASNLYLHTITDFGYFQDKANTTSSNLYGLGFGIGLLNKGGIFNLVYANGSSSGQAIKLSNSIVQVSFKTTF
ncbi:Probable outer membrane protein precursor [Flavobacterium indicum GPTSA100-9 = DSM 17447]|uniref:Probable outer membrane protein n=1 Tax=Flavobacterium indicum (strain DSM 17447 / CIP 109464 / GPTSA100-9) TaxID=1094466 RepID=H8XSG3_FLAIG|nr:membrane protein [Flavobacterium indicum]CCG52548.1 Probable outer membrane protein precursor [Flavobacterium indicum GPTSA100-9 = DSM 17447]